MIDNSTDAAPGTSDVLRAHAEKTEQAERPSAESLEALRADGSLALRTPREHGGAWADAATIARRLTGLGRACPSSAWIAGTCVTTKNIAGQTMSAAGLSELFADPDALFCGSGGSKASGEPVPGGVRISGRWPNVSGCEDAAWAGLAVMVGGGLSFALVPVADLAIERTWHMAGMRGTGSHTLVATDLLVPATRIAPVGQTEAPNPFSPGDILLYALTVLAPVVGATLGALDTVDAMFAAGDRKPFMTAYSRMSESPGARHWLAEATHLVNRAENTMLAVAEAADTEGLTGADLPRLRMDVADAARDCRAAVERMLDLQGAGGFANTHAIQRYWRDIAVGSRHPHMNPYLATETLGTALTASQ